MWNEKEKKEITNLIAHLSEAVKIASGVSLSVNLSEEKVLMLNDNGTVLRQIDISCDSAYGVLADVMKYVLK